MKRLAALVLIPALLTVHCAAHGAGTAVRQQDPPELWRSYAAKLTVGSAVRIATIDGDQFNATLLVVDDSGVTVKPTSRVARTAAARGLRPPAATRVAKHRRLVRRSRGRHRCRHRVGCGGVLRRPAPAVRVFQRLKIAERLEGSS